MPSNYDRDLLERLLRDRIMFEASGYSNPLFEKFPKIPKPVTKQIGDYLLESTVSNTPKVDPSLQRLRDAYSLGFGHVVDHQGLRLVFPSREEALHYYFGYCDARHQLGKSVMTRDNFFANTDIKENLPDFDTSTPLVDRGTPKPIEPDQEETRSVSSTGAEKGTKPARYDLIPGPALDYLARLYGRGAEKYAAHNWRKGYEWSKSYAAAQRHMNAFWEGEDIDLEMGIPHVICASFHMFALATYLTEHPEFDDRFSSNYSKRPQSFSDFSEAVISVSEDV